MKYDDLKQQVQDYLETSEATFVANIPNFVKEVENRVYNEVQMPALRKNVEGSIAADNKYLKMPGDFLSLFSFAVIDPDTGEYHYTMLKDVNLIREVYPSPTFKQRPKYVGLFDPTTLILGPTPDRAYKAELHYFYYPETMVTAGESWLSKNFPSVMLYGVIAEGYRFLKGDAAQQKVYDDQYAAALNLLRKQAEGKARNDAYANNTAKPTIPFGE